MIDQPAGKVKVVLLPMTTVMIVTILVTSVAVTLGNRTETGRIEETEDPALVRTVVTVTITGVNGVQTRDDLYLVDG